jgi:hypothetical protein
MLITQYQKIKGMFITFENLINQLLIGLFGLACSQLSYPFLITYQSQIGRMLKSLQLYIE